jgi:hypothetical protein
LYRGRDVVPKPVLEYAAQLPHLFPYLIRRFFNR